jgi:Arc/MetJ-type ribon-helix-helix transcriptional regulator
MTKITIDLDPEIAAELAAEVAAGHYASIEGALEQAVGQLALTRALQDTAYLAHIRALIDEADADPEEQNLSAEQVQVRFAGRYHTGE